MVTSVFGDGKSKYPTYHNFVDKEKEKEVNDAHDKAYSEYKALCDQEYYEKFTQPHNDQQMREREMRIDHNRLFSNQPETPEPTNRELQAQINDLKALLEKKKK